MTTQPCQCPFICGEHPRPDPRVVSGTDAVAATPGPTAHDACPVCQKPGWLPVAPRVEVVSEGPPKRSVAEILRDPPKLTLDPSPPSRPSLVVEVGPVKPTAVAVGQQWKDGIGSYTVTKHNLGPLPWVIRYDNLSGVFIADDASILADEYLGLAAPAETPPACTCNDCGECSRRTAAPAPGVGEGQRELTFGEAMDAWSDGKAVQTRHTPGSRWFDAELRFGLPKTISDLARWAKREWRLKPQPLPAPALRVSRVPTPRRRAPMTLDSNRPRVAMSWCAADSKTHAFATGYGS